MLSQNIKKEGFYIILSNYVAVIRRFACQHNVSEKLKHNTTHTHTHTRVDVTESRGWRLQHNEAMRRGREVHRSLVFRTPTVVFTTRGCPQLSLKKERKGQQLRCQQQQHHSLVCGSHARRRVTTTYALQC